MTLKTKNKWIRISVPNHTALVALSGLLTAKAGTLKTLDDAVAYLVAKFESTIQNEKGEKTWLK